MAVSNQVFTVRQDGAYHRGNFKAMASDCEILIETPSLKVAEQATEIVSKEAWRIEKKFSRYDDHNIVAKIKQANGAIVVVDDETARLLDFASYLHVASEGAFDITSGVLGNHWHFDTSDKIPEASAVAETLKLVGWQNASWKTPELILPVGSEIDFGGIGKEYAVDRAAALALESTPESMLINFGGDIVATAAPESASQWLVGAECSSSATNVIALKQGGLATSGDRHRYLVKHGVRYSHILDARTGWPVANAPTEVTVAAPSCVEAGMLATLASLQGRQCEAFLKEQAVPYWVSR